MDELKQELFHSAAGHGWKKVGVASHHGINIPLSSLHSKNSCGIGEFFDLIPLIEWCSRLKMDVIQLLPLNNSENDPSPYNSYSSCALNFIHLSLHALPYLEENPKLKKKLKELQVLNTTKQVEHAQVFTHKINWLRAYFDEIGDKLIKSQQLTSYVEHNPWVEHYALYRALTHSLEGTPLENWPLEVRNPSPKEFKVLLKRHWEEASFYIALQYLCFTQLKKVKEHAGKHGVFLMGDLPIFLGKMSVDSWQHPEYFNFDLQAGAPPDYYNKEGQNWGFPLFEWTAMRKKHFAWWKQRLKYAENFYDIFRLDHVLGFFRVWAIPPGLPAKKGHFIPLKADDWEPQGKELLKMISSSTHMLPIAEDLGLVPKIVPPCLLELGISGTKVMRWERKWEEDSRFIPLQYYPPASLTCVSTHDSETLALWWKNFIDEAKAFADYKHWTYTPHLTQAQRQEILWDSHHTSSLFHINLLQEYLALYPEFVWPHLEDERINIPGQVLPSNWTYRFRPSVEEITDNKDLFLMIEKILYSHSPKSLNN